MTRSRAAENLFIPPHNLEAEQAVIGGLMLSRNAMAQVAGWLTEWDFYRRDHQLLFRVVSELVAKGMPCDAVTIGEWLEANGLSEQVGGTRYVIELANATPSAANIVAYAEIVRDKSVLRQTIDVGSGMITSARAKGASSSDVIAQASQDLARLRGDVRGGGPVSVGESADQWFQDLQDGFYSEQKITGLATPWPALDAMTSGIQPECWMIAARPNMGKSVCGFQIAGHAARNGNRVLLISMEQRRKAVLDRLVACFGGIPHRCLRVPSLMDDEHWAPAREAIVLLKSLPLRIDDRKALTAQQIVATAHREHLREALKLCVIDHLHEMRLPGKGRYGELGEAAKYVRDGLGEMGVPLLFLVQLNRGNKDRSDHRPILTDLRGDGALEEVADAVFFLHREEYYNRDTHLKGVLEMIVGKGRDFPSGETVYLRSRFDEMRAEEWEGELPKPIPKEEKKTTGGLGKKSAKSAPKDGSASYANKGVDE